MSDYAVTGASGQFGRHAVEQLLDGGVDPASVVAVVRSPDKVRDLAERGVDVRTADYTDEETLAAAFIGVRRLLFVSGSEAGQRVPQHRNVAAAAFAADIGRIFYTSILNADDTTNPLAPEHQESEQLLRATGIPCTFLRNGWYIENYTRSLGQYLQTGEILGAAGTGRISAATRADYAAAAVAALLRDDGAERVYELGGPSFDLSELAAVVTDVTGTEVVYRDLSAQEYVSALQRTGLDESTANFVAAIDTSVAHGDLETQSTDLADLLGRQPTPLVEVVRSAASAS